MIKPILPPSRSRVISYLVTVFLAFLTIQQSSYGTDISIGMVNAETNGISIHKDADASIPAWHFSTFYQAEKFLQFNADIQYYLDLPSLSSSVASAQFYSGLGLRGESRNEYQDDEKYWMRVPLGLQFDIRPLKIQSFIEGTALVGPMPETKMSIHPSIGLRINL